jgi:hypothetical protein
MVLDVVETLARVTKKWVLYISFGGTDDWMEIIKAAPYLNWNLDTQCIMEGSAVILCESQEECEKLFWQTVGDDGPTKTNKYDGPARVFAITCSSDGQLMNENT